MVRLHPSASTPTQGMKLTWQSSPLAPGRSRVRLPPSPSTTRLRSVNGKHAPFVRPRCGFNSCRRLSPNTSPWCSRQHGELQPRTPGFESWRACSNGLSRAGADRLSPGKRALWGQRFETATPIRTPRPRHIPGLRAGAGRLSVERPARPGGGVFESRPEGFALRSSGAHSWAFPSRTHTTASTTTTTERRCTCRT